MNEAEMCAVAARAAEAQIGASDSAQRSAALLEMAAKLGEKRQDILSANAADIMLARRGGMQDSFVDRLMLDEGRIDGMIRSLRDVAALPDPLNPCEKRETRPSGIVIETARVPLGVVGVIYEARPNVTSDVAGLCIKSGNAAVLRGGKEALSTNRAIAAALRDGLRAAGLPAEGLMLLTDTTRESASDMMKCRGLLDLLIPRGGRSLIDAVVRESLVPVIETGAGNCHIYVDAAADLAMAERIVLNAKLSRPSVCNAAEKLLVHESRIAEFLPSISEKLRRAGCELRADAECLPYIAGAVPAEEEDLRREYDSLIMSVYAVPSLDAAIEHINTYSTHHSDCIVTADDSAAERFLRGVDSAVVYRNASTRFTDGGEFGLGAEIGISTGKLHARGPFALAALTTVKYIVRGEGQVRT